MGKKAISVTVEADNLTWLQARAHATRARSVSAVLDRLVTEARSGRGSAGVRSVVGTIDVDPADPLLLKADEAVRALFTGSLGRPFLMKEKRATYGARARKRRG